MVSKPVGAKPHELIVDVVRQRLSLRESRYVSCIGRVVLMKAIMLVSLI